MKAIEHYLLEHSVYTMIRWWNVMTNSLLSIAQRQLAEGFEVIDEALAIADEAYEA
jgi:hypothetical protein